VGQERRLAVTGGGAYDAYLALQGIVELFDQAATDKLLGTRYRRPQLGFEDDPGRINAWLPRGVNNFLLYSAPSDYTAAPPLGRADDPTLPLPCRDRRLHTPIRRDPKPSARRISLS
jgi:hypothetical protein